MSKNILKTKTFWGGLGLIGYGVVLVISGNQPEGIQNILEGLSIIFLRDAVLKVQK